VILGIGTDLVQIKRFESWFTDSKKILRYFSETEYEYCKKAAQPAASLAVRFAVREAFGKALGTGMKNLALKDLEVQPADEVQGPRILLKANLEGRIRKLLNEKGLNSYTFHVSMSHEADYAQAFVIFEAN